MSDTTPFLEQWKRDAKALHEMIDRMTPLPAGILGDTCCWCLKAVHSDEALYLTGKHHLAVHPHCARDAADMLKLEVRLKPPQSLDGQQPLKEEK